MKYVYVLTSDSSDIYYEQFLVSLTSLKHWNPTAEVSLVCDNLTNETLVGLRSRHKNYVDDVKVVPFSSDKEKHYRSRFLKTTLRDILEGDFLYLDSDTIICNQVDESAFTGDVMGVDDCHLSPVDHPGWNRFMKQIRQAGFSERGISHYINGGVLWMKDSVIGHQFASLWHELWMISVEHGVFVDQPSLNEANKRMNCVIRVLSGEYNCQVSATLKYFNCAKIIHCFATTVSKMNPDTFAFFFLNSEFYQEIKRRNLTSLEMERLLNVKLAFDWGDSVLLSKQASDVYRRLEVTNLYGFIYCLFISKRGKWLFNLMDKFVDVATSIFWKK